MKLFGKKPGEDESRGQEKPKVRGSKRTNSRGNQGDERRPSMMTKRGGC